MRQSNQSFWSSLYCPWLITGWHILRFMVHVSSSSPSTLRFLRSSFLLLLMLTFLILAAFYPIPTYADEPTFGGQRFFGPSDGATVSVVVGDIDGDGYLDIVVGNSFEQNVVYLNDGAGNFPLTNALNFGTNPNNTRSVALGDVDGDGDLDLITGKGDNDTCSGPFPQQNVVYLNDGKGNFPTNNTRNFGTGNDATLSVAVGDVNGDGHLDLVAGNDGQPSVVYLNNGSGSFPNTSAYTRTLGAGPANHTRSVALGDLDSDGDLDIVVGNRGAHVCEPNPITHTIAYAGEQSVIYLNNGDGDFTSSINFGSNTDVTASVAVGDVNGDERLDLVVGNGDEISNDQQSFVYLNNGLTPLSFTNAIPFGTGSDQTLSVAVADVDGDSNLDLVAANYEDQNFVYLNNGLNPPSFTNAIPFGTSADSTVSMVVGDMDNDGDLDLVTGNFQQQNVVYLNNGAGDFAPGAQFFVGSYRVAAGDVDGNGALDLVTAYDDIDGQSVVFLNDGKGTFFTNDVNCATPPSNVRCFGYGLINHTSSVAVADMNGDGRLDLVTGNGDPNPALSEQNVIFLNDVTNHFPNTNVYTRPFGVPEDQTLGVAVGDLNGDGHLDLVTGNYYNQNKVYLNNGNDDFPNTSEYTRLFGTGADRTWSVAVGDMDDDGDLDLITGNIFGEQNVIYLNDGTGAFHTGPVNCADPPDNLRCFGPTGYETKSVAVGDVDGDGDLDLATGNDEGQNVVYLNDGAGNFPAFSFNLFGPGTDGTQSVVMGDIDGDGDLDLVTGNTEANGEKNRVYLNDGTGHFPLSNARTFDPATDTTQSVAVGDMDGDGDLDLISGNNATDDNVIYLNQIRQPKRLANNPPYLSVTRPITTGNANFYSTPILLKERFIPFTYTLFDPERDRVGRVAAFYSLDGGGNWQPALASSDTLTTNLTAGRYPTLTLTNTHVFTWDTFASGVFGQNDNVVLRFEAYAQPAHTNTPGSYQYPNQVAGPYQWPYAASTTFPFRVQGTQVQVLSGTTPISEAIVYRLPANQPVGGFALGNTITDPFHTDNRGYLQGRGQIDKGDKLLALVPVPLPLIHSKRYSSTLRLYYTNGAAKPEIAGLDTFTVTQPGIQILTVSSAKPLLLFDLEVSLEWDVSNDLVYLQQLEFDLQRASEFLYDFTNGQVALGKVTVHQNKEAWDTAHIRIQATNRLRPFAVQGGIVLTETVDPAHATEPDKIVYEVGQVTMGSTWNRYGNAGQNLGQDWPLTLAHELSHYLLFVDDTYLGVDNNNLLIPLDACTGSAMGDPYVPDNTEFVPDGQWLPKCKDTLTQKTLGRSEWATIKLWYPWLNVPVATNTGPSLMPFDFTSVTILPPTTSTATLEDPTFYLDYTGGAVSSSEGQGVLFRSTDGNPVDYETTIDIGSPLGGQNRLLARGAQPGDRLCAFDPVQKQYGCEVITIGDERLKLKYDNTWTPLIRLSPVNSTTFGLTVEAISGGLNLKAKLYPDDDSASSVITLVQTGGVYQGQFNLVEPALAGQVQVWVDETASEDNPRREAVVAFSIGGNPGRRRAGNTDERGGGGRRRAGNAPLVSPDGQFIFFTKNPLLFKEGEFYTIQNLASLPTLPPGKKTLGPSYNLVATPGAPVITGSVSFQYLGLDALTEGIDENSLTIHYWNGIHWQALSTVRSPYYNLVSAPSKGAGIYALFGGVTVPNIASITPSAATNNVSTTLIISGGYFLPPVEVALVGPTVTYTLPVRSISPYSLTAVVTAGLQAREYQVQVVNGDGGISSPPGIFALHDYRDACFYDFFESGTGKWQLSGDWAITSLPNGQQVMTDSPTGPYKSARDYVLNAPVFSTAITSSAFSLAGCAHPVLSFKHAYGIIPPGDTGRVEISTDNGATWQTLTAYANSSSIATAAQTQNLEWAGITLQPVQLDLNAYTGTIRLHFSLNVDQSVSDKGWVLDDVMVKSGVATGGKIFLPSIIKGP